jgi:hypothetical protein
MNRVNFVARKIADVERKNPPNAVHIHGGNEFGVMHLLPPNAMSQDEPLPLFIDCRRVGEEVYVPFDFLDLGLHAVDREAEPVADDWAGGDVPKFRNVLEREVNRLASLDQARDALDGNPCCP